MPDLLKKFKCPQCELKGRLELIENNAFIRTVIDNINQDGVNKNKEPVYDVNYESSEVLDGDVDCFQCCGCGWKIQNISTSVELITYLKEL